MREERYSFEVDIWAIGCIIAEMCLGEPLFNGDSEIEQLFKIFKLIGSPEESMYPEYSSVFPKWQPINFSSVFSQKTSKKFKELSKKMIPAREQIIRKLITIGSVIGESGLDLLQSCLDIDPTKRVAAEAALSHPFFAETGYEAPATDAPQSYNINSMDTC